MRRIIFGFFSATLLFGGLNGVFAQDKQAPEKKDDKSGQMGSCCSKKDDPSMPGMPAMKMGQESAGDMQAIHALFMAHEKISRHVNRIQAGVETVTESDDPVVQKLIRDHVAAMYLRLERKEVIRGWDPLFAEIFKNSDKIKFDFEKTSKGAKIVETSDDPWVVKLIQAHADGVTEFVAEGMPSMHKEHPLPGQKPEAKAFLGKGDGVTSCPVTGEPVNKNVSAQIFGRTVFFCCESCRDTVQKSPEAYLKP
jgi:YHS domain-containing protein